MNYVDILPGGGYKLTCTRLLYRFNKGHTVMVLPPCPLFSPALPVPVGGVTV